MKNWQILFTFFLISLIVYSSLRVSIVYLYYNIDTVAFIEAFCENKDKPELACNGKCHLKKVTEESSNTTKDNPTHLVDFKNILLFKEKLSVVKLNSPYFKQKSTYYYKNLYQYNKLHSVFHPPQV